MRQLDAAGVFLCRASFDVVKYVALNDAPHKGREEQSLSETHRPVFWVTSRVAVLHRPHGLYYVTVDAAGLNAAIEC